MTNNRPVITAYCLEWHVTISSAFHELLVKPLAPYADIRLTAWDGKSELPTPMPDETVIFCQLPPTQYWLTHYHNPIIWIPMADALYHPANMKNHPSVRVVAFSSVVEKMAMELGLEVIRLMYYPNPDEFIPTTFEGERTMLYWNRTGLFYKAFIMQLCRVLQIDMLIFRSQIDPRIDQSAYYELPKQIGRTRVETHATLTSYEEYQMLLRRTHIFIAPRRIEGVGVAFLEAMASGCCVIAYDDVTMNEYIQHGYNGILFKGADNPISSILYRLVNKLSWKIRGKPIPIPLLTTRQNWRKIQQLDIAQLGANARQSMVDGYKRWIASIPAYAEFVLHGSN